MSGRRTKLPLCDAANRVLVRGKADSVKFPSTSPSMITSPPVAAGACGSFLPVEEVRLAHPVPRSDADGGRSDLHRAATATNNGANSKTMRSRSRATAMNTPGWSSRFSGRKAIFWKRIATSSIRFSTGAGSLRSGYSALVSFNSRIVSGWFG